MFSLGCIVFEMLTGQRLFGEQGMSKQMVTRTISNYDGSMPEMPSKTHEFWKKILPYMLDPNPKTRISACSLYYCLGGHPSPRSFP